jgi:hypothetical protein
LPELNEIGNSTKSGSIRKAKTSPLTSRSRMRPAPARGFFSCASVWRALLPCQSPSRRSTLWFSNQNAKRVTVSNITDRALAKSQARNLSHLLLDHHGEHQHLAIAQECRRDVESQRHDKDQRYTGNNAAQGQRQIDGRQNPQRGCAEAACGLRQVGVDARQCAIDGQDHERSITCTMPRITDILLLSIGNGCSIRPESMSG